MKKLVIGAALAVLVGTPVLAADLPVKAPPPAYSWTGFYLGGNVGWLEMDGASLSASPADTITSSGFAACTAAGGCPLIFGSAQANSWIAGAQVGYNYQIQNWVLGIEADAAGTSANASSALGAQAPTFVPYSATQSIKETAFGTIRARVGMLVTPGLLAYATGGVAWAQVSQSFAGGFPSLSETFYGAGTATLWGGTAGAGLEWAVGDQWSVAGEYLYARLGGASGLFSTIATGDNCAASCQFNVTQSAINNNVVRFKVNYHFY